MTEILYRGMYILNTDDVQYVSPSIMEDEDGNKRYGINLCFDSEDKLDVRFVTADEVEMLAELKWLKEQLN